MAGCWHRDKSACKCSIYKELKDAKYAASCYKAVLDGMQFESVSELSERGLIFCLTLGVAAREQALKKAVLSKKDRIAAKLEGIDLALSCVGKKYETHEDDWQRGYDGGKNDMVGNINIERREIEKELGKCK